MLGVSWSLSNLVLANKKKGSCLMLCLSAGGLRGGGKQSLESAKNIWGDLVGGGVGGLGCSFRGEGGAKR